MMHAPAEPFRGDFPVNVHRRPRHLSEENPPRPLRHGLHLLLTSHRVRLVEVDDGDTLLGEGEYYSQLY